MTAEEQVQELTATLEYERSKRQHLLEVETDLARYEAVKALCETHQELQQSERLLGVLPDEIAEVTERTMRRLEALGVEPIGVVGEVVPRCLLNHLSHSAKKGEPVEILLHGYRVKSTGHVIIPAITFPITTEEKQ